MGTYARATVEEGAEEKALARHRGGSADASIDSLVVGCASWKTDPLLVVCWAGACWVGSAGADTMVLSSMRFSTANGSEEERRIGSPPRLFTDDWDVVNCTLTMWLLHVNFLLRTECELFTESLRFNDALPMLCWELFCDILPFKTDSVRQYGWGPAEKVRPPDSLNLRLPLRPRTASTMMPISSSFWQNFST